MPERQFTIYRPPAHPKPERGHQLSRGTAECFLVPSAICTAIWLMTGAGYFWPMWVMLGTGIPLLIALLEAVTPDR